MTDRDQCPQHATLDSRLDKIQTTVDAILKRLGTGDVNIATLSLRVRLLELVIYGGIGVVLIALLGAVIKSTGIVK